MATASPHPCPSPRGRGELAAGRPMKRARGVRQRESEALRGKNGRNGGRRAGSSPASTGRGWRGRSASPTEVGSTGGGERQMPTEVGPTGGVERQRPTEVGPTGGGERQRPTELGTTTPDPPQSVGLSNPPQSLVPRDAALDPPQSVGPRDAAQAVGHRATVTST